MTLNLPCSICHNNVKYVNQLRYLWPRMAYVCCVECARKYKRMHSRKTVV
jgi:hypothetical protein